MASANVLAPVGMTKYSYRMDDGVVRDIGHVSVREKEVLSMMKDKIQPDAVLQENIHTHSPFNKTETHLKCQLVSCMRTSIDNIETWDRHGVLFQIVSCQFGIMGIEWNTIGRSTGLTDSKRNSQNGVGPQVGLIGCTI